LQQLLLIVLLLTVQEQRTKSTWFCRIICIVSELDILLICSSVYIWCMADYQSRPELWRYVQV